MLSRSHRVQWFATIFANLSVFAYGIAIGWPSSNLPRLQSLNTPLASKEPLSLDQASWVGSIYLIGGTISSLFYGWTSEKYGRKTTIIFATIPSLVSWILIEFGTNVNHLYLARFLTGFGGGGYYVAIPLYVSEISSNEIRGALGAMIVVTCNLGIVTGYIINSYLDYYIIPYITISILMVFFVGFPFAAESPKHLMTHNRMEEAVDALKFFRGYKKSSNQFSKEFQEELTTLQTYKAQESELKTAALTIRDFTARSSRKAIFIGMFLNFLCIGNGVVAITNYSQTIFNEAGSTLSSEVSTIIIGLILLGGSYTSSVLIDRAGRRMLMAISSTGCGLSLAILGVYSYLKESGHSMENFAWLPLACLSTFMLLGSIGILSLQFVIMSEVLSQRIRGVICTICLMENWFLAFITVKFFPFLLLQIGMHGCMLIFSVTCFSGLLFVWLVLPETKGKPIEVIIEELERRT